MHAEEGNITIMIKEEGAEGQAQNNNNDSMLLSV